MGLCGYTASWLYLIIVQLPPQGLDIVANLLLFPDEPLALQQPLVRVRAVFPPRVELDVVSLNVQSEALQSGDGRNIMSALATSRAHVNRFWCLMARRLTNQLHSLAECTIKFQKNFLFSRIKGSPIFCYFAARILHYQTRVEARHPTSSPARARRC